MKKIFTVKAYGTYAGGMAVIAASDEAEARQLAAPIKSGLPSWGVRYDKPNSVTAIAEIENDIDSGVLDHYEMGE